MPIQVVDDPRHRQRQHALARRARCAAAPRRRLQLVVVELDSRAPQLAPRAAARDGRVSFVTKRSRWPASRSAPTAADRARRSASRRRAARRRRRAEWRPWTRVYSGHALGRAARSEIELRFSRSSGPGGQHAQKTATRVEALFDVEASSGADATARSGASSANAGPGATGDRPGRAEPAAEPRARGRADRRAAAGGAACRRPRRPTKPVAAAASERAARTEEAPRRDREAPTARRRRATSTSCGAGRAVSVGRRVDAVVNGEQAEADDRGEREEDEAAVIMGPLSATATR